MTYIVDRIEEGFAVLEGDAGTAVMPLSEIPFEIAEGDALICETVNGALRVTGLDTAEKAARAERINKLFNKLFKENQK